MANTKQILALNRFDARHEVNYIDSFWDPATRTIRTRARVVENQSTRPRRSANA